MRAVVIINRMRPDSDPVIMSIKDAARRVHLVPEELETHLLRHGEYDAIIYRIQWHKEE